MTTIRYGTHPCAFRMNGANRFQLREVITVDDDTLDEQTHRLAATLEQLVALVVTTVLRQWAIDLDAAESAGAGSMRSAALDAALAAILPRESLPANKWCPEFGRPPLTTHDSAWQQLRDDFDSNGGFRNDEGTWLGLLQHGGLRAVMIGGLSLLFESGAFILEHSDSLTVEELAALICLVLSDDLVSEHWQNSYGPFCILGVRNCTIITAVGLPDDGAEEAPPAPPAEIIPPASTGHAPPAATADAPQTGAILAAVLAAGAAAVPDDSARSTGIAALRELRHLVLARTAKLTPADGSTP